MPILSNILLEASENTLTVIATDLEVALKATYPAKVERPGSITLSAKKLYEIVKELPDSEIAFATKKTTG